METREIQDVDGFLVESAEGDVGWVEEIWLDAADEPRALALQTVDGRHALLRAEDVLAVDREQRWVVVRPEQNLMELEPPRVQSVNGGAVASWRTTGGVLPAHGEARWHWPLHLPGHHAHRHPRLEAVSRRIRRWPAWVSIAVLYGSLALMAGGLIAIAFLIAQAVTGRAY